MWSEPPPTRRASKPLRPVTGGPFGDGCVFILTALDEDASPMVVNRRNTTKVGHRTSDA